jgi:ribosomal protein S18 acetylase RimI-like enzyme
MAHRFPDAARCAALGVVLRPVRDEDREFMAGLYAQVREAELAPVPWPEAAKAAFLRDQFELQTRHYQANYAGAEYWIVECAGRPIGRVFVHRGRDEIRLMDIALRAQDRGRGLGTALLADLIDEARASGAELTLHVEPDNPACRLYARLGFVLKERRGVYDFLGWKPAVAG